MFAGGLEPGQAHGERDLCPVAGFVDEHVEEQLARRCRDYAVAQGQRTDLVGEIAVEA